jgi:glycerol-3-phosphate dehydrogenase
MVIADRKFISEVIQEISGGKLRYAILSGPSFAEEMVKSHPTCVVIASKHEDDAKYVQDRLTNIFFRVYTQNDVIGVEIAGALKNVVAIGAGIVEGAGYGYNSMAALITRGTREMQRFALKYGAQPGTMSGLSGIGKFSWITYALHLSFHR